MRYYTGKGDEGYTHVIGSCPLKKDDPIVRVLGDIDELNSAVGFACANITDEHLEDMLIGVQNTLFVVGAEIASSGKDSTKIETIKGKVKELEEAIEELGATLPELKKFVLPRGTLGASCLHLSRAICRRAEGSVAALNFTDKTAGRYLNRLSSFLFVAALYVNKKEGVEETSPAY
jgi:cob(I)alamin adenosyltransferase